MGVLDSSDSWYSLSANADAPRPVCADCAAAALSAAFRASFSFSFSSREAAYAVDAVDAEIAARAPKAAPRKALRVRGWSVSHSFTSAALDGTIDPGWGTRRGWVGSGTRRAPAGGDVVLLRGGGGCHDARGAAGRGRRARGGAEAREVSHGCRHRYLATDGAFAGARGCFARGLRDETRGRGKSGDSSRKLSLPSVPVDACDGRVWASQGRSLTEGPSSSSTYANRSVSSR